MIRIIRRNLVLLSGFLGIGVAAVATTAAASPVAGPLLAGINLSNHCEPFHRARQIA
jgi:hypothetical protein